MILEYHRPKTMEEALELLGRPAPVTVPLGGGTMLNRPAAAAVAVVDLQALGLDLVEQKGKNLQIGARVTLQALLGLTELSPSLQVALRQEMSYNLRQVASVAGCLLTAEGRSPLATVLLAMDASVQVLRRGERPETMGVGELLLRRAMRGGVADGLRGCLITRLDFPAHTKAVRVAYETVARTPADRPLVCAAAAVWESGRMRVTLGGTGRAPVLVLDGPEPEQLDNVRSAAQAAFSQAGDEWAGAEFRQQTAGILAARCVSSCINISN